MRPQLSRASLEGTLGFHRVLLKAVEAKPAPSRHPLDSHLLTVKNTQGLASSCSHSSRGSMANGRFYPKAAIRDILAT